MATILIRGARRCDSSCYNAKTPPKGCRCICQGRNHGVGLDRAVENTREALSIARATARFLKGEDPIDAPEPLKNDPNIHQLSIWGAS